MFSFAGKREPENHQRFRRAGPTRKGLLAPFRPQRRSRNGKKLAASLNAFFSFLPFTASPRVLRCAKTVLPADRCLSSAPYPTKSL
ncbi:hypothetical protein DWZ46_08870 [Faecalibacterium prausnitzii]|uniref:Uncharacterized protein n=1 Tax=Faecalibacterium prausnitzii TaxID=853 RepID=A0A3E2U4P3_9FIRM|nr:hypothetical protein DWZ46_08870 [Faecalibacterium prausnitzii]